MKIHTKIYLLIVAIVFVAGIFFLSIGLHLMHKSMERELVEKGLVVAQSLPDLIAEKVIKGETLLTTEILKKIVQRTKDLEYIFIIGFEGEIFAHSFKGGFPKALTFSPHKILSANAPELRRYLTNVNSSLLDICYPLIEGMKAHIHLGINNNYIDEQKIIMRNRLISLMFLISIIGIITGYFLSLQITLPLQQLTESMKSFAKGKEADQKRIHGCREVAKLSKAFDHMKSERTRAEEVIKQERDKAQIYLNVAGVAIVALNAEQKVTLVNRKGCLILDYDEKDILGQNWFDNFLPKNIRGEVKSVFNKLMAGEIEPVEYFENPILTKSGYERIIAWQNSVLRDQTGKIIGTLTSGEDITERRQAEEEIRRLNEELEKRVRQRTAQLSAANKELEAFSYSVSHDLRAPLRGIDGFSKALLEDYSHILDEEGQDYLNRVRSASQHMGRLITDILKLSQVSRSRMEYETLDLSAIARQFCEGLHKTQPDRRVELIIAPNIKAKGDATLLRSMMENLLDNAWKFTSPRDHARIEFGVEQIEGETVHYIRDNGVGFDMTYADKLFVAFQRLHKVTEFPGTGVGLATVQRVINRHGGRIWAESAVEKGAAFYFTL